MGRVLCMWLCERVPSRFSRSVRPSVPIYIMNCDSMQWEGDYYLCAHYSRCNKVRRKLATRMEAGNLTRPVRLSKSLLFCSLPYVVKSPRVVVVVGGVSYSNIRTECSTSTVDPSNKPFVRLSNRISSTQHTWERQFFSSAQPAVAYYGGAVDTILLYKVQKIKIRSEQYVHQKSNKKRYSFTYYYRPHKREFLR